MSTTILSCIRCDSPIQVAELDQGLAVRVDGELICQMCVDSLPGEAQVKINQLRAMRGLNATTYSLNLGKHPALHLFTFTTAGNITVHRRAVHKDGEFSAPPLPPRSDSQAAAHAPAAVTASAPQAIAAPATGRSKAPLAVAAGIAVVLCAGAALAYLQLHGNGAQKEVQAAPALAPPAPAVAARTRDDYPSDPVEGWSQASQDRECPAAVRQAIALELKRRLSQELDAADRAIKAGEAAEAQRLLAQAEVPDDIVFRDLRQRDAELRKQLAEHPVVAEHRPSAPPAEHQPEPVSASPAPSPQSAPGPTSIAVPPAPAAATLVPPSLSAAVGESWRIPGRDLVSEDSAQWKRIGSSIHLTSDVAVVRKSLLLDGGTYQIWVQAINHSRPSSVQVSIGGQHAKQLEIRTGGKVLWMQLQNDAHPTFTLPAGESILEISGMGHGLEVLQLLVYDSTLPNPEQSDHLHAKPPRWGAPPPGEVKEPAGALAWKPRFVQVSKELAIRQAPLDGSVYLPPGWPGGLQGFWRSVKINAKKRHVMTLDLHDTSSENGGIALLLHPGRLDRKQLQVTAYEQGGKSVTLPPFQFSGAEDWEIFTIQAKSILDGMSISSLTLEDDAGADFPAEDGFILAKVATSINQPATPALLALRPPALVRDEHRAKNLLKLIEAISRFRKHAMTRAIDTAKLKLLVGPAFDGAWRAEVRRQLELLLPGRLPANLEQEISFQDSWFESLTRSPGAGVPAILEPAGQHIVIIATASGELKDGRSPGQALESLWKKRLEQLVNNGMLPLVVLGPSLVDGDKRATADALWAEVEDFITKQMPGVPMIDLRSTPLAPTAELSPAASDYAATMIADGYSEFIYWLHRAGGAK